MSDPNIEAQIHAQLKDATMILNIGAGTGSYEPQNVPLVAVEPSSEMIAQRKDEAHPVKQAFAEDLPFAENTFSHTMTVLSMHHWQDRAKAFKEINRVTTEEFVAVTWNPETLPFWLTKEYFPQIYEMDKRIFPNLSELEEHFSEVKVIPLYIPENCQDGFLAAYWKRPHAYLDANVRAAISTFSKLGDLSTGIESLRQNLREGSWERNNQEILNLNKLDVGYVIVKGKIMK